MHYWCWWSSQGKEWGEAGAAPLAVQKPASEGACGRGALHVVTVSPAEGGGCTTCGSP